VNGVALDTVTALVDGEPDGAAQIDTREVDGRRLVTVRLDAGRPLASIGLRLRARGVRQYLRHGYMSWDGSYFVDPIASQEVAEADPLIRRGHAMTALLPADGPGALVVGFLRHDRFQSQFRFALEENDLLIDVETLLDGVPGAFASEELVIFAGDEVEESLREWARLVAAASPLPPRLPVSRFTGWCSWYSLYASLSEPVLLEHLEAARRYRDDTGTPFDVFLVDDGFTSEMGDWLEFKPQFPSGIKPVIDAARDVGFTPGLWIAPFMVGNRSKLFTAHPDWVVRSRSTGAPLAPMKFYGEFRWHKRSEEYYVLDVTHLEAEAYIRQVLRVWAKEWGVGYFKTDFMHLGSTYGPEEAIWQEAGLSRMAIWMRMARLIREEIGDAKWLLCGSPIWAPVGLCDAMRTGRDIGVSWEGHYSAQSLLRDQTTRNFANGILWQADPDCILLRDRFHDLSNHQVHSLATFAGLAGGVLMTSDQLDEVPEERRALLHELADDGAPFQCDFPELGQSSLTYTLGTAPNGKPMGISHGDPVLIQRVRRGDGTTLVNVFNTGNAPVQRTFAGRAVELRPHQSVMLTLPG
jgi:alpha-galactosidase